MRIQNKKVSIPVMLMSILVAFFIDIPAINTYIMPTYGNEVSSGGTMAFLYLFDVIAIFIIGFISNKSALLNIPKSAYILTFSIILFYFATTFFIGFPFTNVTYFGVFTLAAFIIPFISTIDVRILLKCIMLFSLPAITKLDQIFIFVTEWSESISMGLSYAFLTPVLVSIVYLFTYFKKESFIQKLITIFIFSFNMIFASYLVTFGSRGPVFSIIILFIYLFIISHNKEKNRIVLNKLRLIQVVVGLIILLLLFTTTLRFLKEYFEGFGISLNFINKFLELNDSGDISNGRDSLFEYTLDAIFKSPIWGYGFDQFANNHGLVNPYPHNFILQIFYDGGIILFALIFIPLYKRLKIVVKTYTYDNFVVFTTMMFASIPGAMVSGDLWQAGTLWMFFGSILSCTFVNKYNYE